MVQEPVEAHDVARAGAAFAARREDLGISQRALASRKVISAPALIAFEKGRAWPRERTRAQLEEVVRWPAGTLARLRAGAAVPDEDGPEPPDVDDVADGAPLVVSAVEVAMDTMAAAVANLPDPQSPRYADGLRGVLADLRRLETITTKAVRTSSGAPEVMRALASVRRRYDELMALAAEAPGATLGQRLYAARRGAHLTATEAAEALGSTTDLVLAVEAEEVAPRNYVPLIEGFIADIAGDG